MPGLEMGNNLHCTSDAVQELQVYIMARILRNFEHMVVDSNQYFSDTMHGCICEQNRLEVVVKSLAFPSLSRVT